MKKVEDGNQVVELNYNCSEGNLSVCYETEFNGDRFTHTKTLSNIHNIPNKVDEEHLQKAANALISAIEEI